jgi:hypothetical protein
MEDGTHLPGWEKAGRFEFFVIRLYKYKVISDFCRRRFFFLCQKYQNILIYAIFQSPFWGYR